MRAPFLQLRVRHTFCARARSHACGPLGPQILCLFGLFTHRPTLRVHTSLDSRTKQSAPAQPASISSSSSCCCCCCVNGEHMAHFPHTRTRARVRCPVAMWKYNHARTIGSVVCVVQWHHRRRQCDAASTCQTITCNHVGTIVGRWHPRQLLFVPLLVIIPHV